MKAYSEENHSVRSTYLKGFFWALLLTLLAFGLVIANAGLSLAPIDKVLVLFPDSTALLRGMPLWTIAGGVIVLAVLQILVHLRYFLHLSFGLPLSWNLLATLFALFIIIIMVGGTLWIMNDLDSHMRPGTMKSSG